MSLLTIAKKIFSIVGIQAIFICGKNEKLREKLTKLVTRTKKLVIPYTDKLDYYLKFSDLLVGKPGPGSLTEALVSKIPVFITISFFYSTSRKI